MGNKNEISLFIDTDKEGETTSLQFDPDLFHEDALRKLVHYLMSPRNPVEILFIQDGRIEDYAGWQELTDARSLNSRQRRKFQEDMVRYMEESDIVILQEPRSMES